ncbi:hypothetical protein [Nocardioides insulae]|uniref:hypothetical protein n=1 Tax=Nocardioides insulae TaxID=394734 RepID=UPI0012F78DF7|nr:hypothetical protein [Nocardioides insulae]
MIDAMIFLLTALVLIVLVSLLASTWYVVRLDRPRTRPPTSHGVDPDLLPPSMRLFPH